jgi:uncharacterized oligopeptide transporter (OPT) family protein
MALKTAATIDAKSDTQPFIGPEVKLREFTPRAVILGVLLGVVFGASSLYLVLKVGMTVSASIPVAVISLSLFRLWAKMGGRDANILENNIVQTAGSAGESIAFGVGVTMPAIMILGFDLEVTRVMIVGVFGALLGILMMIPLRRALIVQQDGELKYPEGTACAEVLKAGANEESRAASQHDTSAQAGQPSGAAIFGGFGVGLLYSTAMRAFKAWKDTPEKIFGAPLNGGSIAAEISPELLGVGYIIGPRISCIMAAGGVLSYLVLIPLIKFFGAGAAGAWRRGICRSRIWIRMRFAALIYFTSGPARWRREASSACALDAADLARHPDRVGGFRRGGRAGPGRRASHRTRLVHEICRLRLPGAGGRDLGRAVHARMNWVGAMLIVVFGFLFVTVSSRLTGEIGSSSNPISGMTVATLLLTCLTFLLAGWTGVAITSRRCRWAALFAWPPPMGGHVAGFENGLPAGSDARYQQIAIMIGAALSALTLGPILLALNTAKTVYVPIAQVAPGLRAPADASFGARDSCRPASKGRRQVLPWLAKDRRGGRTVRQISGR